METLIAEAENYVITLLNNNLDTAFVYHNISHTQRVVEKCTELASKCDLTEVEKTNVLLAAWFHDTGYTKTIDNHEKESVKIANTFLKKQKFTNKDIDAVSQIIMATQVGYQPKNKLERIIRDADCSHVGSKNYSDNSELLRKEWELASNKTLTENEWLKENIDFLTTRHKFYTPQAAALWEKTKGRNLSQLIKAQKKLKLDRDKLKQKQKELAFKKSKIELPERGIETMFRVALRNHITLSDIADTKANILLSVNAIIVSLALSNLLPKLDNPSNQYLIIPSIIFIVFTVISIVLSVLATRPNVTKGKFTKADVDNRKVNLLFFGNFHQMKLDEFEWAMNEMMKDRDYLYGSLNKDLYFLGLVLNRKYNLLRTTYTVFIIGILISVFAFGLSFYLSGGSNATL